MTLHCHCLYLLRCLVFLIVEILSPRIKILMVCTNVLIIILNVNLDLSCFFHYNIAVIRPRVPYNLLMASQSTTPRITPTGSPPSFSASVSPTRTSRPISPRRHSISFYDDRSSALSSIGHGSISSSDPVTGPQAGEYIQLCYLCTV